jgi:hypothetical protein
MRLVLVEWVDSSSGDGWRPLDELAKTAVAVHCRSTGWVASDSDEAIALVSHISGERNGNIRLFVTGDIAIPKCAVVRITDLQPVEAT